MEHKRFDTAQEAFEYYYDKINKNGQNHEDTKRLQNIGFYINYPMENSINTTWRKWSDKYAMREWQWYLSGDRSVKELEKYAPIWGKMHGGHFIVNSNYGYQWNRCDQLNAMIEKLKKNPGTRQATLTILDSKEWGLHTHDTPCTISISFTVTGLYLNMTVLMRSNDLWYGFCNDQFCFSKLQELVASELHLGIGWYYHFAQDLHLYNDKLGKKPPSAMKTQKKRSICQEAHDIVYERSEEKERQYGPFNEGMERAAQIASGATGKDITDKDMYMIIVALKLSRESYMHKEDNILDAIAYLAALNNSENEKR